MAHQVSDIWAKTSPDRGEAVWALWPMGGAWLCTHLWEHYSFTMDKVKYLKILRFIFFFLLSVAISMMHRIACSNFFLQLFLTKITWNFYPHIWQCVKFGNLAYVQSPERSLNGYFCAGYLMALEITFIILQIYVSRLHLMYCYEPCQLYQYKISIQTILVVYGPFSRSKEKKMDYLFLWLY